MKTRKPHASVNGIVTKVFYNQNGFFSGLLRVPDGETVRICGAMTANEHDAVILRGNYEQSKYGVQFRVSAFEFDMDFDIAGIIRYITCNPAMKGIGPQRARAIAEFCGEDFDRIVTDDPKKLLAVRGITPETATLLHDEWVKYKSLNKAITFLAGFGLTHKQIDSLIAKYGNFALQILKENPYRIIEDIQGYGFKRADGIALKMGAPKEDPNRIGAGLLYLVRKSIQDGDTWIETEELVAAANKLLIMDGLDSREIIQRQLEAMIDGGTLSDFHFHNRALVSLPAIHGMEAFIGDTFKRLRGGNDKFDVGQVEAAAPAELNRCQRQAYLAAASHKGALIAGGAGTGKSYVVARIAELYKARGCRVALAAPTGKAARRIEELVNMPASTIHRLLRYNGFEFARNQESPLNCDVVIVDECFDYKQPILTKDGWRYIGVVVNNKLPLQVWSRNPQSPTLELKPIVRWLKRPAPTELLKITASRSDSLKGARVIQCTQEHKIMTPYGYRKAGELRVGEEVIVKGYQFTLEQRSILIGSALGDACIHRNSIRNSPQASFTQGDKQRDYLEFKKKALGALASEIVQSKSGYTDNAVWRFTLAVLDETFAISNEMIANDTHASGRKKWTPTDSFLEWIDEQALAIWYMDNGSLRNITLKDGSISRYVNLHTERFSKHDNERLSSFLFQRFGIQSQVAGNGKGLCFLRFNKKNSATFLDIVEPYIPACMSWKARRECNYSYAPKNQPETCIARVQSIEKIKPTSKFVYDIEVADNHNYIAGNIVVSNCSMLDVPLCHHLFKAIDFTKTNIVLVGDHNQLPPVGPGNIIRDILANGLIPTVILDQVVRQAGILKENSIAILDGRVAGNPQPGDGERSWYLVDKYSEQMDILNFIVLMYEKVLDEKLGYHLVRDVQLLAPMKKGLLGVDNLNIVLQRLIQRKYYGVEVDDAPAGRRPRFYLHDKVIQLRNNYDLGVMNGSIGVILDINPDAGAHTVLFDEGEVKLEREHMKDIALAFGMTLHKAQGSEYECGIVIIHKSHSFMHHRNLFYTGVTRAKKTAVIIGDRWGVRNCAKRQITDRRRTFLSLEGFRSEAPTP